VRFGRFEVIPMSDMSRRDFARAGLAASGGLAALVEREPFRRAVAAVGAATLVEREPFRRAAAAAGAAKAMRGAILTNISVRWREPVARRRGR
jgi:predicted transcriptional regulator